MEMILALRMARISKTPQILPRPAFPNTKADYSLSEFPAGTWRCWNPFKPLKGMKCFLKYLKQFLGDNLELLKELKTSFEIKFRAGFTLFALFLTPHLTKFYQITRKVQQKSPARCDFFSLKCDPKVMKQLINILTINNLAFLKLMLVH